MKLVVFVAAVSGAFLLGRLSRPQQSSGAPLPAPALAATATRVPVAAASGSMAHPRAEVHPVATPAPETIFATTLWLRKAGMISSGVALAANQVGPQVIGFFDLTPAETATLNAAVARAAQRMAELADQHASGRVDEATRKLIVEVPAYPEDGGRVYDELLGQFRAVLGPERFTYFDPLFGDNLERNYDGFGIHRVRYEVELTPMATSKGQPVHRIERSFVMGDGTGTGRSNSQLPLDHVAKYHPILKRFLPPALAEAAK